MRPGSSDSPNSGVSVCQRRTPPRFAADRTTGHESLTSLPQGVSAGTFHPPSPKRIDRFTHGFAGRHNIRDQAAADRTERFTSGLTSKRLHCMQRIAEVDPSDKIDQPKTLAR